MRSLLPWILPPLAGAVIGYVTNAVAVKMLFRPLKEIRVAGFRLPFTPGILPRERRKLALSIGRMVERELLTPGVLRERLANPGVRGKMRSAISGYTAQLLDRPVSSWLGEHPAEPLEEDSGIPVPAGFPVTELLNGFVGSDVFGSFLEELLKAWTGQNNPQDGDGENLGSWLKSRMRGFGTMFIPAAKDMIKSGLVREIRNRGQGETPFYRRALENTVEKYPGITLGEFLSVGGIKKQQLDSFLAEKAVAAMDENTEAALSSVDIKAVVQDRIDSLDMLTVEKIILDVMSGQLKWINVFGAILGALIGFLQVLLSFVM